MDKETLKKTLIYYAKRDYFNGRGRIDFKEFIKVFNLTMEEIKKALEEMGVEYRFYPFVEEPTYLFIFLKE